jgi:hypothetical protein
MGRCGGKLICTEEMFGAAKDLKKFTPSSVGTVLFLSLNSRQDMIGPECNRGSQ